MISGCQLLKPKCVRIYPHVRVLETWVIFTRVVGGMEC